MPKKILILSGHGTWEGSGAFKVPDGMKIHFFVPHGCVVKDFRKLNKKLEEISDQDELLEKLMKYVVETKSSTGKDPLCYDYTLTRPQGVTKFRKNKLVKEVSTSTRLSEIVAMKKVRDVEHVFWYACRGLSIGSMYTGISTSDAALNLMFSASTAIENALMRTPVGKDVFQDSGKPWDGGFSD